MIVASLYLVLSVTGGKFDFGNLVLYSYNDELVDSSSFGVVVQSGWVVGVEKRGGGK